MALNLPETFTYEKRGHIAVMTLNRPQAMNAIDPPTSAAMARVWQDFAADDGLLVYLEVCEQGAYDRHRRKGLLHRPRPQGGAAGPERG